MESYFCGRLAIYQKHYGTPFVFLLKEAVFAINKKLPNCKEKFANVHLICILFHRVDTPIPSYSPFFIFCR